MRPRPQCPEGFSLLEVMIAMAVIAIALVTLLGLSNRTILVQDRIQKLTRATLLAQQLMTEHELELGAAGIIGSDQEGVFDEPFADFRWQISYEGTPLPQVRQVQITVVWGRAELNEQVELTSFVSAGDL
ncbi:MAG: prepilin-type N-terminal cleavage/methylation domain-containing protein [Pelovirga sp.]